MSLPEKQDAKLAPPEEEKAEPDISVPPQVEAPEDGDKKPSANTSHDEDTPAGAPSSIDEDGVTKDERESNKDGQATKMNDQDETSNQAGSAVPQWTVPVPPTADTEGPDGSTTIRFAAASDQGGMQGGMFPMNPQMFGPPPVPMTTTSGEFDFEALLDNSPLVFPSDRGMIPDSLFTAIGQMRMRRLVIADQVGCYKTRKIGFPGLACRFCGGRPGNTFGSRYFPETVRSLSQTTTSHTMVKHIASKCRGCPASIRNAVVEMQRLESLKERSQRRGHRKEFFQRVWDRLHGGHVPEMEDDVELARAEIPAFTMAAVPSRRATPKKAAAAAKPPQLKSPHGKAANVSVEELAAACVIEAVEAVEASNGDEDKVATEVAAATAAAAVAASMGAEVEPQKIGAASLEEGESTLVDAAGGANSDPTPEVSATQSMQQDKASTSTSNDNKKRGASKRPAKAKKSNEATGATTTPTKVEPKKREAAKATPTKADMPDDTPKAAKSPAKSKPEDNESKEATSPAKRQTRGSAKKAASPGKQTNTRSKVKSSPAAKEAAETERPPTTRRSKRTKESEVEAAEDEDHKSPPKKRLMTPPSSGRKRTRSSVKAGEEAV